MFPPMTPQTERRRIELENQEREQQAAYDAAAVDGEGRHLVQAITRLLTRERKPKDNDVQVHRGVSSRAEQTA